jgi:hypothetical protein
MAHQEAQSTISISSTNVTASETPGKGYTAIVLRRMPTHELDGNKIMGVTRCLDNMLLEHTFQMIIHKAHNGTNTYMLGRNQGI